MDVQLFKEAMNTLLSSWGSDTPPEAIWAANEFMDVYYEARNIPTNARKYFVEDDDSDNNSELLESII